MQRGANEKGTAVTQPTEGQSCRGQNNRRGRLPECCFCEIKRRGVQINGVITLCLAGKYSKMVSTGLNFLLNCILRGVRSRAALSYVEMLFEEEGDCFRRVYFSCEFGKKLDMACRSSTEKPIPFLRKRLPGTRVSGHRQIRRPRQEIVGRRSEVAERRPASPVLGPLKFGYEKETENPLLVRLDSQCFERPVEEVCEASEFNQMSLLDPHRGEEDFSKNLSFADPATCLDPHSFSPCQCTCSCGCKTRPPSEKNPERPDPSSISPPPFDGIIYNPNPLKLTPDPPVSNFQKQPKPLPTYKDTPTFPKPKLFTPRAPSLKAVLTNFSRKNTYPLRVPKPPAPSSSTQLIARPEKKRASSRPLGLIPTQPRPRRISEFSEATPFGRTLSRPFRSTYSSFFPV